MCFGQTSPTHLSHKCPIPISHHVLTSHFNMCRNFHHQCASVVDAPPLDTKSPSLMHHVHLSLSVYPYISGSLFLSHCSCSSVHFPMSVLVSLSISVCTFPCPQSLSPCLCFCPRPCPHLPVSLFLFQSHCPCPSLPVAFCVTPSMFLCPCSSSFFVCPTTFSLTASVPVSITVCLSQSLCPYPSLSVTGIDLVERNVIRFEALTNFSLNCLKHACGRPAATF